MRLKYEPSSEPIHIFATLAACRRCGAGGTDPDPILLAAGTCEATYVSLPSEAQISYANTYNL